MTVTHEVFNQPAPLADVNLFETNRAMQAALAFNAPGLDTSALRDLGRVQRDHQRAACVPQREWRELAPQVAHVDLDDVRLPVFGIVVLDPVDQLLAADIGLGGGAGEFAIAQEADPAPAGGQHLGDKAMFPEHAEEAQADEA